MSIQTVISGTLDTPLYIGSISGLLNLFGTGLLDTTEPDFARVHFRDDFHTVKSLHPFILRSVLGDLHSVRNWHEEVILLGAIFKGEKESASNYEQLLKAAAHDAMKAKAKIKPLQTTLEQTNYAPPTIEPSILITEASYRLEFGGFTVGVTCLKGNSSVTVQAPGSMGRTEVINLIDLLTQAKLLIDGHQGKFDQSQSKA